MLVSIHENDPTPIYLQIVRQLKEQILVGELRNGQELPSVRELGDALGISLHTARSAYQTLSDEGLLRIRLGKRARIADPMDSAAVEDTVRLGDAEMGMADRVRDVVVDALLFGLDATRIHGLIDTELEKLAARRAGSGDGGSGTAELGGDE